MEEEIIKLLCMIHNYSSSFDLNWKQMMLVLYYTLDNKVQFSSILLKFITFSSRVFLANSIVAVRSPWPPTCPHIICCCKLKTSLYRGP